MIKNITSHHQHEIPASTEKNNLKYFMFFFLNPRWDWSDTSATTVLFLI